MDKEDVKEIVDVISILDNKCKDYKDEELNNACEKLCEMLISKNICPYCGERLEELYGGFGVYIYKCTSCKKEIE